MSAIDSFYVNRKGRWVYGRNAGTSVDQIELPQSAHQRGMAVNRERFVSEDSATSMGTQWRFLI